MPGMPACLASNGQCASVHEHLSPLREVAGVIEAIAFVAAFYFFCKFIVFPFMNWLADQERITEFTLEAPTRAVLTWNGKVVFDKEIPAGEHKFSISEKIPQRTKGTAILCLAGRETREFFFVGAFKLP
jgi:hypothetical protein